jgi:hypothetical protein
MGIDRRCFSYSGHIPERRRMLGRRSIEDRRFIMYRGLSDGTIGSSIDEQRIVAERRSAWD